MTLANKLKIAICDDDKAYCEQITAMTCRILEQADIPYSISAFAGSLQLLDAIHSGACFHVLLLDVMMNELDGMELAALLRAQKNPASIVFISCNLEMALRGYEVSAVRFLAKPVEQPRLEEALLHCCDYWQKRKEILLPTDQGHYRTSFSEIQYVEAFERRTRFVLTHEVVDAKLKFSEAEALLPRRAFLQCHRAFLVNMDHIRRLRADAFELKSGIQVPISKHRYNDASRRFFDYLAD